MWTAIEDALEESNLEGALDLGLEVWRVERQPAVADLVDAITARLPPVPALTPRGTTGADFQRIWLSRAEAGSSGTVTEVYASLTRSVPISDPTRTPLRTTRVRFAAWLERIDALSSRPADPRLAAGLVDALRRAPFSPVWGMEDDVAALYEPVVAALAVLGDVRQRDAIHALASFPSAARASVRRYQREALPQLVGTLDAIRSELPTFEDEPACRALLEALGSAQRSRPDGVSPLLELVYADPSDDGAREVLGDRWLEVGDPRGQLVSLQLREARGSATEADRAAARALLREHGKRWLGPLALVTRNRVFERGFLSEIELVQNAAADPTVWASAALDQQLRTVQVIHKGKANETHFRRFVFSPAATALREVVVVSRSMLEELCAREPSGIESLELDFSVDAKVFTSLAESNAVPRLAKLTVVLDPKGVEKAIGLVAGFLDRRPLAVVAARPARLYDPSARLVGWLRAASGRLAGAGSVEISLGRRSRLVAQRGKTGLRIDVVHGDLGSDLADAWAKVIFQAQSEET